LQSSQKLDDLVLVCHFADTICCVIQTKLALFFQFMVYVRMW